MRTLRTWLDRLDDWQARIHARVAVERMEHAADPAGRMTRGQAWALLGYFAALLASRASLPHLATPPLRVLVALVPLPFVVAILALSVRHVLAMDELRRRIEGVALAVSAIAAWLGLGVCWLLQHAGVPVPVAQLGFVGMPLLYVFARHWAGRRYA
jgi:hypothetical protein